MRFNITKAINILAAIIIFFVCLCADSLMDILGPTVFLLVALALVILAFSMLRFTERLGRRYILIGKRRRKAIKF